jgi:hypothetical protein
MGAGRFGSERDKVNRAMALQPIPVTTGAVKQTCQTEYVINKRGGQCSLLAELYIYPSYSARSCSDWSGAVQVQLSSVDDGTIHVCMTLMFISAIPFLLALSLLVSCAILREGEMSKNERTSSRTTGLLICRDLTTAIECLLTIKKPN